MIENHIQKYLYAVFVQCSNHGFQLITFMIMLPCGGIAGIGCEEADGIVAPVIHEVATIEIPSRKHFIKLEYGH